ncbi:MAG: M48 family metallopeptidase [Cryomorphaceae bacterium]|nr:M48 family metallopeptidase [Cryomorphaceae bacterium]
MNLRFELPFNRLGLVVLVLTASLLFDACKTVPLSGRRQVRLVPNSELNTMSFSAYQSIKDTANIITGTPDAQMVERCGKRIQKSVEDYFAELNQSSKLEGFEWEFILIDDPTVNAWCMPGGKVAFYTGILPYTQDETGLAVVMGHEIAHAVAQHGNERMSQGLLTQFGAAALGVALRDKREETQALFMGAYGMGAQVGAILPFSRKHESEADELGLYFMAMAGYNPQEAPKFWTRMSQASGGMQPPEFVSTHPSNERRISDLEKNMPRAMKYYEAQ